MNYINSLPDGWTIYIWLIAGAMIVVAVIFAIRWALHNDQFDEDIKYLVFDEEDKDKMSAAEFAKSREVLKEQMKKREHFLAMKDKEHRAHDHS